MKILKDISIILFVSILIVALGCEIKYLSEAKQSSICIIQTIVKNIRPSYDELKSHSVYLKGCAEGLEEGENYPFATKEDEMVCWRGSGSVIKIDKNYTYILTNNHVAGKNTKNPIISVEDENGNYVTTEIVRYHKYVDLAVVKYRGHLKGKTIIPRYALPKIQENVFVVGQALGNHYIYSEGIVAGRVDNSVLIQAPLIYGNSGSAILNEKGSLVGVCFALQTYPWVLGLPAPQITHSLIVDSIDVQMFLKDLGLIEEISYE